MLKHLGNEFNNEQNTWVYSFRFFFLNELKIIFLSTENSLMKFVHTEKLKQMNKSEAEG